MSCFSSSVRCLADFAFGRSAVALGICDSLAGARLAERETLPSILATWRRQDPHAALGPKPLGCASTLTSVCFLDVHLVSWRAAEAALVPIIYAILNSKSTAHRASIDPVRNLRTAAYKLRAQLFRNPCPPRYSVAERMLTSDRAERGGHLFCVATCHYLHPSSVGGILTHRWRPLPAAELCSASLSSC